MQEPNVLVLANKRARSWPKAMNPPVHPRVSLRDALHTKWDCDAHVALYGVRGMNDPMPRLSKAALPRLRSMHQEPSLSAIFFDVDNPGHAPWSPEYRARFDEQLERSWIWLRRARAIYSTANGYRIAFALPYDLTVEQWLGYEYAIMLLLQGSGVSVDVSSSGQWTRLFRLPSVVRDGQKTWENPYYFLMEPTQESWDVVSEITPNYDRAAQRGGHRRMLGNLPMPPSPELDIAAHPIYKHLRMRFGRESWGPAVFPDRRKDSSSWPVLAAEGSRHNEIIKVVGVMAPIAAQLDAEAGGDGKIATPELLWSILYEPIELLGGDDQENFHRTAWDAILSFWSTELEGVEEGEEGADPEEIAPTRAGAAPPSILRQTIDPDILLFRVQEWLPQATIEWLRSAAIIRKGPACFVLGPDGRYGRQPIPIAYEGVANIIQSRGLTALVPLRYITNTGEWRDRSTSDVMRHAVHQVSDIRFAPTFDGTLDLTDNALLLPCHRLLPIEPEFNEKAHEFLFAFADEDQQRFQHLCWMLAGMLATREGKMPAAHFYGPPGAGKGMLVSAIARAFTTDSMVVSGETFFSRFNDSMLETPIIHIDEKMPDAGGRASARFRAACSGDPIPIEPKNLPLVRLRAPFRILITTNNAHAIRALFRGESLVEDDIDAIRERLQVFKVSSKARNWLDRNGHFQTTEGWISKERPALTKHLLWLYEQYKPYFLSCAQRFLLPPNLDRESVAEHIFSLESVKGIALLVFQDFLAAARISASPQAAIRTEPDGQEILYIQEPAFLQAVRESVERAGIRESRTDHHIRERAEQWGFCAIVRDRAMRSMRVLVPALERTLRAYNRA